MFSGKEISCTLCVSECGFARKSMPRKGNECEESSEGGEEVSCLMSPVPSESALFRSKLSFAKTVGQRERKPFLARVEIIFNTLEIL
jgi:hypothetical protein